MALMRPTVRFTVDGRAFTAAEAALVGLRLQMELGGAHDAVTAVLGPLSPLAGTEGGAAVELALGYGDDAKTVFTGAVTAVDDAPGGQLLEALAATWALSRTRVAQSFVQQTIAHIVAALLGEGDVAAGEIEAPLKLFAYHVDERRSVWAHLRELARLASCDLVCAADGAVSFRPPRAGPAPDHRLRYGADLVRWSVGARDDAAAAPDVVPHGAASEEGAERWHILLGEPDGGAPSQPTLVPPALRDRDGARAFADGLAKAAARRARRGTLVVVGNAALRPGDVIELQDVPGGAGDGLLRALAVTHIVDGAAGFRTALALEAAA